MLRDHICKQMNELNLERCRCIPKEVPGADWRCLEQLVAQDPAREQYKVHLLNCVGELGKLLKRTGNDKETQESTKQAIVQKAITYRESEAASLLSSHKGRHG